MRLSDLRETLVSLRFPSAEDDAHPDRDAVASLRAVVAEGLRSKDLLVELIGHELSAIEDSRVRPGLSPFHVVPDQGVRLSFGYWAPGLDPGAHEHTAWTVTAVVHNQLEVQTFDRGESYRRRELVAKRAFIAEVDQVGFIYEPAIHAPRNVSTAWTLSLHLTSPRDGEPIPGDVPLLPRPVPARSPTIAAPEYLRALRGRERHRKLGVLAETLIALDRPSQTTDAIARCFHLGSSRLRRALAAVLPEQLPLGAVTTHLARVDDSMMLDVRRSGDRWALCIETPAGARPVLLVGDRVAEAMTFAARTCRFDVRALPGPLSDDERTALADSLEESGAFYRVNP